MANEQAAATREAPGRSLDGRYRLDSEIGAGGLGVVYRATHEKLAKTFAVKLLHAHCGENAVMRGRFEREAKMLASLDHPNIVAVTDFGIAEDAPYLVMELLEGETLADSMARGPFDQARAASLSEAMLRALAFVHANGLVHRDVKPGNVFLQRLPDGSERLKVLDFGLAKLTAAVNDNEDPTLTRAGSIVGTPAYMSPEQASGEEADARSDVYAAGVIVIQMLAGRLPFLGDAIDQLRSHLVAPVPTLAELCTGRVGSPELDAFIARAMAKRREERFANAGEMLTALEAMPRPWFTASGASTSSALGIASTLVAAEPVTVAAISGARERSSESAPGEPAPELRSVSQLMAAESRRMKVFMGCALGAVAIALFASGYAVRHPELAVPAALEQHPKPPLPAAGLVRPAPSKPSEAPTALPASEPSAPPQPRGAQAAIKPSEAQEPIKPSEAQATIKPSEAQEPIKPSEAKLAELTNIEPSPAPNSPSPIPAPADDVQEEPRHTQPIESESDDVPVIVPAAPKTRAPARDPWRKPVPKELRAMRGAIAYGIKGSDHTIADLRRYNRAHPSDPRGHLLLANLYFNRDWRSDAIDQYSIAYQIDPSARGAPGFLSNLLTCVVRGYAAGQAARLIDRAYHREALASVERAAHKSGLDARAVGRLNSLRARLAARD